MPAMCGPSGDRRRRPTLADAQALGVITYYVVLQFIILGYIIVYIMLCYSLSCNAMS